MGLRGWGQEECYLPSVLAAAASVTHFVDVKKGRRQVRGRGQQRGAMDVLRFASSVSHGRAALGFSRC